MINKNKLLFNGWEDKNPQPPDLDMVLKEIMSAIKKALGLKNTKIPPPPKPDVFSPVNITAVVLLVGILTILCCVRIYVVAPAERAVITRFGRYIETLPPGLHWYATPINTLNIINVEQIQSINYHAEMLTKDENYVVVDVTIMYRIADPKAYLYSAVTPDESVYQAAASAARQAAGQNTLEKILTTGRSVMRAEIEENLNRILDNYAMGIVITDVKLQEAKPPQQVQEAFDDAINAREDEQRYINKAMAYRSEIIPAAKGIAYQLINDAEAYKNRIVQEANAEAVLYKAQLGAYLHNPSIQTIRLQSEMLEKVLAHHPKVISTQKNGLTILPLSDMLQLTQNTQEKTHADA